VQSTYLKAVQYGVFLLVTRGLKAQCADLRNWPYVLSPWGERLVQNDLSQDREMELMAGRSPGSLKPAGVSIGRARLMEQWALCRCNVDMLKLIQLGLTFSNAEGNLPKHGGELCVWQFNFRQASFYSHLLLRVSRQWVYWKTAFLAVFQEERVGGKSWFSTQ
jgi:hypothetical protein